MANDKPLTLLQPARAPRLAAAAAELPAKPVGEMWAMVLQIGGAEYVVLADTEAALQQVPVIWQELLDELAGQVLPGSASLLLCLRLLQRGYSLPRMSLAGVRSLTLE
jgi:hypothetical protein